MTAALRNLRKNPHFLFVRLPYILSFLCIVAGVTWLLPLPLDDYSRKTYISENALLPGQVHAYFSGSEQHIFRGYKKEIEELLGNNGGEEVLGQQSDERTPVYVGALIRDSGDIVTDLRS
jgi:glycosylphosphatidylinositol transamidase